MEISSQQLDWVALGLAVISFTVWLVRLEGKVKANEKATDGLAGQVKDLTTRHEALDSELVKKLSSLERSVARIEGYLKAKNELKQEE